MLEQKHIDKIVETYEKRVDVDKFAHVAEMSEIVENGYNLNIPRYVDTFEEEEPVDLEAVRAEIKRLDVETKNAIEKAESMLQQLGYKGESNYIWDNQVVKMLGKELFIIIM